MADASRWYARPAATTPKPSPPARIRKWRGDKAVQVLPAQAQLQETVAQLNRFRPAILATYASIGALLADEQAAGRLRINPSLVMLLAEGLPAGGYDRIARVFNIEIHHSYAANERLFISYNCDRGWLHVNSDSRPARAG